MCSQSHGAVLKHRSSVIKICIDFRQLKLVLLTYAERCCGFHACLQKKSTEGRGGFREERAVSC